MQQDVEKAVARVRRRDAFYNFGGCRPRDTRGKYRVLAWVYWQVGGLGPMAGQAHHFLRYAPQQVEYAMHRFRTEVARLYKVMDTQLGSHEYLAGEYSIADIAAWPWVVRYDWQGQDLKDFPNVKRLFEAVGAHARGKITDAQLPLWNAVADAIRAAPKDMSGMPCMSMMQSMMQQQSSTLPETLAAREKTMTAHLEAFSKFKTAVEPLYAALNDDQKKTADQLLVSPMTMMGLGMM